MLLIAIIGNYTFIYGNFGFPEMGARGAGLSAVIGTWTSFILLLFYLIIRIFSSYYFSENPDFFIGECNSGSASIYYYLNSNFNISITNILFQENSHLSMRRF